MYTTLTECLRELIPYYLREYGFRTLHPKYWGIISDINTHGLKPVDIQRKRRITRNQYYAYLKVLKHRGWTEVFHSKRKRTILMYFPILDRNKQLYSSLVDLQLNSPEAIMRLIADKIDRVLYQPEGDGSLVEKAIVQMNRENLKMCSDHKLHNEWDAKLRTFIQDFISMPVSHGVDFESLEEKFKLLSQADRLRIFTEAKRRQMSLWDVLNEDLTAVFIDILAEEEKLVSEDGVSLKDLIKSMGEANGWGLDDDHGVQQLTLSSLYRRN